ncbi:phage integrase N-terminal SAM-like domain-containing protein (plasmid) [Escherichia coli]
MHYSLRTEQAYVHWVRAFIRFHGVRHPATLGSSEVEAFLSLLANERKVSVPRIVRHWLALPFFYGKVLCTDLPWLQEIGRPRPSRRLPVAPTPDEVVRASSVFWKASIVRSPSFCMERACGSARVCNCGSRIRDFHHGTIIVRRARAPGLGLDAARELGTQPARAAVACTAWRLKDQAEGRSGVALPDALERKYPRAGHSWRHRCK